MAHYQQLSDQLIAPHLGEPRSFFYDPTTKQLRKEYVQYPADPARGLSGADDITEKTDQLAAQLHLEQRHHR